MGGVGHGSELTCTLPSCSLLHAVQRGARRASERGNPTTGTPTWSWTQSEWKRQRPEVPSLIESDAMRSRSLDRKGRAAVAAGKKRLGIIGFALLLGWAGVASAQTTSDDGQPSAEDIAAARSLGAQGVTLAIEGNCAEAIDPLSRAEQLYHAPTILTELGYCKCEVGELVEGTELLNRVVREQLGPDAPPAFVNAQARAKQLLEAYTPRLASLVIHVQAPEGAVFEVAVDGKPVSDALLGAARPTDPGERRVTASGEGLEPAESSVNLTPGGQGEVTLVLTAVPNAEPPPAAPIADEPPPASKKNLVPAYIAFGVGAVGLGVGGYFGASALGTKSDLDDRCRSGSCPSGSQSDIDSLSRDGNIATIGFAVGLVGVGAGIYFLLTAEESPSQASRVCADSPCVRPQIGLGHLGMEGSF